MPDFTRVELGDAIDITDRLAERGVLLYDVGRYRIRAVTHLDLSREQAFGAGRMLQEAAKSL